MPTLRFNIKPFDCLPDVVCGDDIEALWGNQIRNLGQSAFERGETVLSLSGPNEGIFKIPLVGFCWNFIKSYGNNSKRHVRWANGTDIRFQPAQPYYHYCDHLYEGNANDGTTYGAPVIDNGIEGVQYILGSFENAGYNNVQVLARVRRGKRNVTGANITASNSDTQVYELQEDDNDPVGYEQHIQCWYCRENPSGPSFPPTKWLIFDDNDCPLRTYTDINKVVSITPPLVNQTEKDYIVVAVWYSAPYYVLSPGTLAQPGFSVPNGLWVNDTSFHGWNAHPDGLLDINVKLFKQC